MGGRFVFERSIAMERLDWCRLGWVSGPAFNVGDEEAKALAIFGACVGDGIGTVDVFSQAP